MNPKFVMLVELLERAFEKHGCHAAGNGDITAPNYADARNLPVFRACKARIRQFNPRHVEELDPARQALLEIYVATVLDTPFNDFDNH
jgi:hypothetical protein